MGTLPTILIPAGLALAYVVVRAALGRPLARRSIDVLLALLLLAYFLTTAGLGIFWVASHELPVFDLHYVFGYVTLGLVAAHVALNWKTLLAWFQRRPQRRDTSAGRTGRRSLARVAGWAAALLAYGGCCFWLGQRQSIERIEIVMAQSSQFSEPAATSDGPASRPTGDAAERQPEVPAAVAIQPQTVRREGRELPLALYYHERSSYSRRRVIAESSGVVGGRQPSVFKHYRGAPQIDLPAPAERAGVPVGSVIESCRAGRRGKPPEELGLGDLSTLLFMTNGVTAALSYPGRTYHLRAAPSAGALYPTVTYVVARRVTGLPPGLYHYAVREHKLNQLSTDPAVVGKLAELVPDGRLVADAPATLVFSSIFHRSAWKYGGRAYRYCCLDAGHLAVQAQLAAAALGYPSSFIGRFDDAAVNALLDLEAGREGVLLLMPLSVAGAEPAGVGRRSFRLKPQKLDGPAGDLILTIHGRTHLERTEQRVAPFPPRPVQDKPYPGAALVPLPGELEEGDDVFATIRRRRSVRRWAAEGLTVEQLSSVLYYSFAAVPDKQGADASVENSESLLLYVVVNDVEGLEPGAYHYRRTEHALSQISAGDYQGRAYGASLLQEVVGECHAWLVITVDRERLGYPDGDRGYRYAGLDAGMLGGRVYLQATGLGLGCCGVGAFYDDEVAEIIGVDPQREPVLYTLAIGRKSGGRE